MTGRAPRSLGDVAALRRAAAMLPLVPSVIDEADDWAAVVERVDVDRAAAVRELEARFAGDAPWWCPACGTVGVSDASGDEPGPVLATV